MDTAAAGGTLRSGVAMEAHLGGYRRWERFVVDTGGLLVFPRTLLAISLQPEVCRAAGGM